MPFIVQQYKLFLLNVEVDATVNELLATGNVNMVYRNLKADKIRKRIALLCLATNRLRILDNVFDTVTKCLLTPFKSVEQSKLHHSCLSKKNCSFY